MDIYNFNKETKEFISKTVATESPLEKGVSYSSKCNNNKAFRY